MLQHASWIEMKTIIKSKTKQQRCNSKTADAHCDQFYYFVCKCVKLRERKMRSRACAHSKSTQAQSHRIKIYTRKENNCRYEHTSLSRSLSFSLVTDWTCLNDWFVTMILFCYIYLFWLNKNDLVFKSNRLCIFLLNFAFHEEPHKCCRVRMNFEYKTLVMEM